MHRSGAWTGSPRVFFLQPQRGGFNIAPGSARRLFDNPIVPCRSTSILWDAATEKRVSVIPAVYRFWLMDALLATTVTPARLHPLVR